MKKVTVLFSEPDQRSVSQPDRLSDRSVPDGGRHLQRNEVWRCGHDAQQRDEGRKACGQSILGWVATGDASVSAAKAAGGITTVASVDHSAKNILGILGEWCTIVRAADHACCPSEEGSSGTGSRRPFFFACAMVRYDAYVVSSLLLCSPARSGSCAVSICRRNSVK